MKAWNLQDATERCFKEAFDKKARRSASACIGGLHGRPRPICHTCAIETNVLCRVRRRDGEDYDEAARCYRCGRRDPTREAYV